MVLGRIIGNIVCTKKDNSLIGLKMQVVQPLNLLTMQPESSPVVAIDAVGAGDNEVVLMVNGSSARQTAVTKGRPVDATVMAIVDTINVCNKKIFDRQHTNK